MHGFAPQLIGPLAALALLPRAQLSSIVGTRACRPHFFLAVLLKGDYCSNAGLGTSLQSQAGRSTVVLAREVSQLPGSLSPPTLSLNWYLHKEGCLVTPFPN